VNEGTSRGRAPDRTRTSHSPDGYYKEKLREAKALTHRVLLLWFGGTPDEPRRRVRPRRRIGLARVAFAPSWLGEPNCLQRGSAAADRSEGAEAADAIEGAEGSRGAAAVEGVGETGRAGGAEAIASALSTGAIDAAEAKAQLIEAAVRAQLPEGTDPAIVEAVRAEVEALLANDPVLEDLLRA
jgi:hypothetical protein